MTLKSSHHCDYISFKTLFYCFSIFFPRINWASDLFICFSLICINYILVSVSWILWLLHNSSVSSSQAIPSIASNLLLLIQIACLRPTCTELLLGGYSTTYPPLWIPWCLYPKPTCYFYFYFFLLPHFSRAYSSKVS